MPDTRPADYCAACHWPLACTNADCSTAAKSDAPRPALGELARLATADIAELNDAAQEYEDSADVCDTPALARLRRRRYAKAEALRAASKRIAQLVALATGGAETARLREALEMIVDLTADEDDGDPEWTLGQVRLLAARSLTPERPADV